MLELGLALVITVWSMGIILPILIGLLFFIEIVVDLFGPRQTE